MNLSFGHILVLLLLVLIVMGPSRLEGVGSSLGKAIKGFKKGLEDDEDGAADKKKNKSDSGDKT
jgi:sec-independent protein translocase protein TatA